MNKLTNSFNKFIQQIHSVHGVSEDSSSDSGDSILTVELHPAETISAVHEHEPGNTRTTTFCQNAN